MNNFNVVESVFDELGDKSSVTVPRGFFGAEQTGAIDVVPEIFDVLDGVTLVHDRVKFVGVLCPRNFFCAISIEERRGRRENQIVNVSDAVERLQKKFQVTALCETGKLRVIGEAHVDEPTNVFRVEEIEKLLGGFLGEADCKKSLQQLNASSDAQKILRLDADQ